MLSGFSSSCFVETTDLSSSVVVLQDSVLDVLVFLGFFFGGSGLIARSLFLADWIPISEYEREGEDERRLCRIPDQHSWSPSDVSSSDI